MSGRRVIAINDDPVQLAQITSVLAGAGYQVDPFECAAAALDVLAAGSSADLFVLDLHMPGIDGWKMCQLLRSNEFQRFNATPVLVLSATYAGDDVVALTRDLGADGFIEAPFDAQDLLAMVGRLLDGGAVDRAPMALIIEDEPAVRELLARAFTDAGYAVQQADSVESAREAWRTARPNVVLLDHHLPDGTSEDLLDDLVDPHERTPVLVMTGDADPFLPVRLFSRGADGYLRKPFEPRRAVEHARSVARQRALLRIGSVLKERHREQQVLERNLHNARRLESLGLLAGGIAHEFNNILAGIMGHADLALLDLEEGSPGRSSVAQIAALARRAAERTRQILVYSGKARLTLEEIDLADVVAAAVGRLDRASNRRVEVVREGDLPRLRGDRERLVEMVLGLIVNGIEALGNAPGGVTVALGAREVSPTAHLEVEGGGTAPSGRYAFIQVLDEGSGMDEATRARIFDPFFTTKFMGRGLGLAAVLGIVRAHGGHIHVRTAPERGTVVTALFPL
jgi:DNA-binding response OmpR family regulator